MTATWSLFLAAVNMGNRNKVSMSALARALEAAEFLNVQTYLQSGNVIVDTKEPTADSVASSTRDVLTRKFELTVPVIVRTPPELRSAIDTNPFPSEALANP